MDVQLLICSLTNAKPAASGFLLVFKAFAQFLLFKILFTYRIDTMETVPNKNPHLSLLIVILIVVIGIAVSVLTLDKTISLEGSVVNSIPVKAKPTVVATTPQITDDMLASYIATNKASKVLIDTKVNTSLRKIMDGVFGTNTVSVNAYMYYCRSGAESFLYQTQINLGSTYQTASTTCIQVVE